MKRILSILIAVLMVMTFCALTGCGDNKDVKQKEYEELFNDASKIETNSMNISAVGTSNGMKALEVQSKESGDMKMVMYLTEDLGYTTYNIGDYSYLEIHIPEYKDSDGKTVKAEDVYYKTINQDEKTNVTPNFAESLDLTNKENIKSVKYVETKEVKGVTCDVVEVTHVINQESEEVSDDVEMALEDSNDSQVEKKSDDKESESETTDENDSVLTIGALDDSEDVDSEEDSENTNREVEVTTTFYFISNTKKLYGYKATSNGLIMECYFLDDLKVELPKDIEFVEANDEEVGNKMMSLYSYAYSQLDISEEVSE